MADSNKTYFGSPSEIRRRMMMTAKTGGGGYPQPIALQTDGLAHITLPMNLKTFAQKNPRVVFSIEDGAKGCYIDDRIVNSLIIGHTGNGDISSIASGLYGSSVYSSSRTVLLISKGAKSVDVLTYFNKAESYLVRTSRGNYTAYIREYGTSDEYMSANLFVYAFEDKSNIIQIFSGIKISLYSLALDDMNLVPHFNGTEYGLLDTMSETFYGNDNTEGEFIPIFEEDETNT